MDIRSLLTVRLGLRYPLIQAPMAGVQGSALAIAVCEAGGLGSLPCAMLSPDQVRQEVAQIRSRTQRPFHLNFFAHTAVPAELASEARWRETLAPYYAEAGLDPRASVPGPSRQPYGVEMADLIDELRPAVLSFHFGLPPAGLLARAKASGALLLSSATTVEEARWLEAQGVDAVIAQGVEAGGHRGMFLSEDIATQLGTFALLPQVVKAVRLPVIAAGGIAGPEGVRAAMALGASAVQVGTSYLLCPEATTSAVHRAALKDSGPHVTALTRLFSGRPARGIVNRLMRELGPMNDLAPAFPHASAALAPLRAHAEKQGRGDFSSLWSGENASGCRELPAGELTRWLSEGFVGTKPA